MKKFEELVGQKFDFYGVDGCAFKIGEFVFEAIEDPDDGYRSYLGSVEVIDPKDLIFFKKPLAKVELVDLDEEQDPEAYRGPFTGYGLVDNNGHVWLRLGTDDYDDYYPCFMFNYDPPRVYQWLDINR